MKLRRSFSALAAAILLAGAVSSQAAASTCDGNWSITLERTVRGGKKENYEGRMSVADGKYTLKAMADIYVMVSEGDIKDCKLSGATLNFTNRSNSYALDLDLGENEGKGSWYDTTFKMNVVAKR